MTAENRADPPAGAPALTRIPPLPDFPLMLSILLNGANGRMGKTIAGTAAELGIAIGAAVDLGGNPAVGLAACGAIVDFSAPSATRALLDLAIAHGKPIVIGTTGHDAAEKKSLLALAARVPCVWAGNYSVGVNLLFALTRRAARTLGPDYDAEVIEMHHRFKKDAPSGTADRLLEIILEERQLGPRPCGTAGRAFRASASRRRSACIHCAAGTSSETTP